MQFFKKFPRPKIELWLLLAKFYLCFTIFFFIMLRIFYEIIVLKLYQVFDSLRLFLDRVALALIRGVSSVQETQHALNSKVTRPQVPKASKHTAFTS